MARACPACDRPNSDTAAKCLYCAAPLPLDQGIAGANDPEALEVAPEPARSERYLVVLIPAGVLEGPEGPEGPDGKETLVETFSRITGLGLYESRQHLLARRPRLFRRLESEAEARALSMELARANVPHYVVEEASMLALPISHARAISIHDRHLQVTLDRTTLTLSNGDLVLVVHGDITRERHHEERLGSDKGVSHRLTPEQRLHLYAKEATVAIEIEPDAFDWSVLSDRRTSSSVLNVKRFLESLEVATSATLDRGFTEEPVVLSRSDVSDDPSRVLAEGERSGDGIVWDNVEQFRYYARWRYRLERYLRRADQAV